MDINLKAVMFISQVSTQQLQYHNYYNYTEWITRSSYYLYDNVNLVFVLSFCQFVARGMVEGSVEGSIVNVSSQASQCALKEHTVYCKLNR